MGDLIKKNLLSIIALTVGLAALIASWIISSGMTKAQIEDVRQDAVREANAINSILVDYELPPLRPGEEPWSLTRVTPNARMTQVVGERLRGLVSQSEQVREAAIAHNRAGKNVLVQGLFPAPEDADAQRVSLSARMVAAWPVAHQQLLEDVNAGQAMDGAQLTDRLTNRRKEIVQSIRGSRANQELSAEEEAEITEELVALRLSLLKAHADNYTVFADKGIFRKLSEVPSDGLVTADRYQSLFWDWQHAYWVHRDLMMAVAKANDGMGVSAAPVKRIISITLEGAYNSEVTTGDLSQPIPEDYTRAFTGRNGGNPLYDVRYADVEAIIDLARLPEIENAISSTNFMTLIDLDYTEYSPDQDLRQGYFYGDQSLVRARMRIETVWIRSWIEEFLPPRVREAMGLPVETDTPDDDDADQF
jgi:hypothetical protein